MSHIETLLSHMFIHIIRLKMFHFQCASFGHHTASDKYLDGFLQSFDKFFEVAQGIYGKLKIDSIKFPSIDVQPCNIHNQLNNFVVLLGTLDNFIKSDELLTIRDDMINNALQLKYLLTFN